MSDQFERINKMASLFADQLGEHCTAVRIVCTYEVDGKNESGLVTCGYGNFHSQFGAMMEWVIAHEEEMRERVRPH